MGKVSFSDSLAIGGGILAIVLVILDKAGKLRGSALWVLLAVAGLMAVPLLMGMSWVADATPGRQLVTRRAIVLIGLGLCYWGASKWLFGGYTEESEGFSMQIDFAILGQQSLGSHVAIVVTVANKGTASSVLPGSWELRVATPDGRKFEGQPFQLKDKNLDFCFPPSTVRRFVLADAIYLKTTKPVENNDYQQGFIWFGVQGLDSTLLRNPATALILSAKSVAGQEFETRITVAKLEEMSKTYKLFPGITHPAPIQEQCSENQPY